MMSGARIALLAASGLFVMGVATAQAADLGGNCCADLEERVAELEATTARKGNRKVSLTISGWVNEAVFAWDDGIERNAYVGTNSLEQDRIKFAGEAKIADGWSAGYVIELGINGTPSSGWDQVNTIRPTDANNPGPFSNNISTRHAYWFLKSKTYGSVRVGTTGTATYHLLDDADGANTRNYSDAEAATVAMSRFLIVTNGARSTSLRWSDFTQGVNNDTPGQNGRRNIVRYDTPEFAGFVATASWGEDDMWGMALTYKGEVGDFKLVGKVGYEENSDSGSSACNATNKDLDCQWWGAAGTIMHKPTGLYVYGGYGEQQDDSEKAIQPLADNTDTTWFVQAGLERKFVDLGKTTIFGEYRNDEAGSNLDKNFSGGFIKSSDIDFFAGGVVQNIENAAMDLYVIYRHAEGDSRNVNNVKLNLDDFDMLITGARIQF
jgi:predicted porin